MGENNNIGIITEQGDLGLGFDLLNEQDSKIYKESIEKKEKEDSDKNKK